MYKILLLSALLAFFVTSCKDNEEVAFAFGNFESEEIIVSAESSGRLMEFPISEGQSLTGNFYCGYIDTMQLHLKKLQLISGIKAVNSKKLQLEKQLLVNEVSMSNLMREKDRIFSLLEGGAATSKQKDDLLGQIELLKAQTQALASQNVAIGVEKESHDIQILQVNDLILKSLIYSPLNGIVLEKYLYAGELAVTGKPLFKIADLSELTLRAFVSGNQLEKLKIGSIVNVFIDAEGDSLKSYTGTISWISDKSEFTPKIIQTRDERVNLVYAVKVKVPNDGALKIGMPAELHL